ncbi:putative AbiEi antitoxin of type IV toxin-antitoxin system [Murinocardiopsis flavida]|uniref:Putative AbiEi antitoxin of type IV toxin-antitoxin system n=2 Tax=Murinocardiopsis flavida TaxID=645275 RepID=A0A2P8DP67_9ACTN|nr:putative AbiEi antitoxin of type IV toxin-antitoxin system [Murinocardiopsis flavida]
MRTAAAQHGLVTRRQAFFQGLNDTGIKRLLREGRLQRWHPGVYAVRALTGEGSAAGDLRTAVMAAQLAIGPAAVAVGPTAASLWGMQGLAARDGGPVHVSVPGSARFLLSGVAVNAGAVHADETVRRAGIRITTPGRTLRDTVLSTPREVAVSLMDSARNGGMLSEAEFASLRSANAGRRGQRASAPWWALSDPRAQSPLETRIRLICTDADLPPDDLQHPLRLPGGRSTAYGDLWWDRGPVLVEADGAGPHSRPDALFRDRHRQNALLHAYPGLRLLRFSWRDLRHPRALVAEIARAGAG